MGYCPLVHGLKSISLLFDIFCFKVVLEVQIKLYIILYALSCNLLQELNELQFQISEVSEKYAVFFYNTCTLSSFDYNN